jgi:hypothetical protein
MPIPQKIKKEAKAEFSLFAAFVTLLRNTSVYLRFVLFVLFCAFRLRQATARQVLAAIKFVDFSLVANDFSPHTTA